MYAIGQLKYPFECSVCDTKIRRTTGTGVERTGEYNEIDVVLNNLSTMTVGVCSKHRKPKRLELVMIAEKAKKGWMEEVAFGIGNEAWVRRVGMGLEVVGVKQ